MHWNMWPMHSKAQMIRDNGLKMLICFFGASYYYM